MKKILALIVALLICLPALSRPAKPGLFKAVQPDGSVIYLRLHGDEFCHWRTNTEGQVVEKGDDGFWRPVQDKGMLRVSQQNGVARRNTRNRSYKQVSPNIARGQKHFLVILVEFADVKFSSSDPNQVFSDMMNKAGYNYRGATGSARDYYFENSHGLFEPVFDVYGPVTLKQNMAYYGENDINGYDKKASEAVASGCSALNDQIDFSLYDNDNDGEVDLVYMYYAGFSEAEGADENTIWPHQWDLYSAGRSLICDGKQISRYACSSELSGDGSSAGYLVGIGAACHEFAHAIGLPDFYDTDYETNDHAAGPFDYSLMCRGSYNNDSRTPPYFSFEERIMLGWFKDSDYKEFAHSGQVVLTTVNDDVAYRTPTDQEGEYFVYECRTKSGWDAYVSPGLIVTHIDKSSRIINITNDYGQVVNYSAQYIWDNWHYINSINENGSHPCYYIVPSADQSNLLFGHKYYTGYGYYYDNSNSPYIPFPGKSNITTYAAESWNGVVSDITLSDITYADNKVSFNVYVPSDELEYNVIDNPGNGVYAAGDLFEFKLIETSASPVSSVAWYFDDEPVSGATVRLKAGRHTVEAVLTLSSGDTQTVTLEISVE